MIPKIYTNHLDILLVIPINVFNISWSKASFGSFTLEDFVRRSNSREEAIEKGFEGTVSTLFSARTRSNRGDEPGISYEL